MAPLPRALLIGSALLALSAAGCGRVQTSASRTPTTPRATSPRAAAPTTAVEPVTTVAVTTTAKSRASTATTGTTATTAKPATTTSQASTTTSQAGGDNRLDERKTLARRFVTDGLGSGAPNTAQLQDYSDSTVLSKLNQYRASHPASGGASTPSILSVDKRQGLNERDTPFAVTYTNGLAGSKKATAIVTITARRDGTLEVYEFEGDAS